MYVLLLLAIEQAVQPANPASGCSQSKSKRPGVRYTIPTTVVDEKLAHSTGREYTNPSYMVELQSVFVPQPLFLFCTPG